MTAGATQYIATTVRLATNQVVDGLGDLGGRCVAAAGRLCFQGQDVSVSAHAELCSRPFPR